MINIQTDTFRLEIFVMGDDAELVPVINAAIENNEHCDCAKDIIELLENYENVMQIKVYDLDNNIITISDNGFLG